MSRRKRRYFQKSVLSNTNHIRRSRKLQTLRMSATLCKCAKRHTIDQAFVMRDISHHGSDKSTITERLERSGYDMRLGRENVAFGQRDPAHLLRSLMGSPGHRENILCPRVEEMGIYVVQTKTGRLFWTQLFGKKQERSKPRHLRRRRRRDDDCLSACGK